jgi:ACS family glucarate transporter-like MFS transporter
MILPVSHPVTRVRWRVVFALFAIAAVSFLDRNNISIAAGAIQKDFGLSNVQLGVVFSAFVAGYALAQPQQGALPTCSAPPASLRWASCGGAP